MAAVAAVRLVGALAREHDLHPPAAKRDSCMSAGALGMPQGSSSRGMLSASSARKSVSVVVVEW